MSTFPTHKHLCSWAGICPGNNQSGGKRQSGKIRKSNKWLKAALVRCAHAAGKSKDTYLGVQFRRFAGRKGKQRAAIVTAHSILESIYFILRDGVDYHEMGPAYFDQMNKEQIVRQYKKRLEALGMIVDVREAAAAA